MQSKRTYLRITDKKMIRFYLAGAVGILLVLISEIQNSFGNENISHYENLMKQGNEFYAKGNFDSAVVVYQNIINADFESANLYYNLGNAYYKMKNIPSAILFFEKAKKLDQGDNDILFNLQLANQQITDKIEPLPEMFLTKWWNGIISSVSMDSWAKWAIILAFYAMFMFMFFNLSEAAWLKKLYFWTGVAGISLAILSFTFALKHEKLISENAEAIVFSPSVTAKSSPDDNSTNLFVIHEGIKVKILEKVSDWYKISLPDGNIGWMKKEDVKGI